MSRNKLIYKKPELIILKTRVTIGGTCFTGTFAVDPCSTGIEVGVSGNESCDTGNSATECVQGEFHNSSVSCSNGFGALGTCGTGGEPA